MDDAERMLRHRAKTLMRKRFRSRRASLPPSAVAARSRSICERLLALDALEEACRVALFWPIERMKEVDLRDVDRELRQRGSYIAYPQIDPSSREMTFRRVADVSELSPSPLGFMAPPGSNELATCLDVVVVPGLAFDGRGYRIGYGGGFYDAAIPTTRPTAIAIGVAFDFQLAADLPCDERDVPVDVVVTDVRTLHVK